MPCDLDQTARLQLALKRHRSRHHQREATVGHAACHRLGLRHVRPARGRHRPHRGAVHDEGHQAPVQLRRRRRGGQRGVEPHHAALQQRKVCAARQRVARLDVGPHERNGREDEVAGARHHAHFLLTSGVHRAMSRCPAPRVPPCSLGGGPRTQLYSTVQEDPPPSLMNSPHHSSFPAEKPQHFRRPGVVPPTGRLFPRQTSTILPPFTVDEESAACSLTARRPAQQLLEQTRGSRTRPVQAERRCHSCAPNQGSAPFSR